MSSSSEDGLLGGRLIIFDIGMSEGNDARFYLEKGFRVVGVEADPLVCEEASRRFSEFIAQRRLTIVNRAAAYDDAKKVAFWRDRQVQGHSSLLNRHLSDDTEEIIVETISYPALCRSHGDPYYVKIDIEGGEAPFLRSFANLGQLPFFVSAECRNLEPIEVLAELGYRHFKLINQVKLTEFKLPDPSLEGRYAPPPRWLDHWSGPFGRELPGPRWFSYPEIRALWRQLHDLWALETLLVGWFDCHACRELP